MKIVSGLFDTADQADAAVKALNDAGIPDGEISVIGPEGAKKTKAGEDAGIGAALGGVGGLIAGLGAFAIPGIGPVIGIGWLATTLAGAVAGGAIGGMVGAMSTAGIDEDEAHTYAEHIKRGGTLVTARVDETHVDAAAAILGQAGSIDPAVRRAEYEETGWSGFEPTAREFEEDAADAYKKHQDRDPVVMPFPR